MMQTEFTNPTSGWAAECRDCDYVIEPDYGAQVWPRSESGDRADVEHWADKHRRQNPGHQPKVTQFHRWTLTIVEHLRTDLLEAERVTEAGRQPIRVLLGADQIPPDEIGACCGHEYRRHLVGLEGCADCERWEPEHARCTGWRRQLPDTDTG